MKSRILLVLITLFSFLQGSTPVLIQQQDEEALRTVLARELPDLQIKTLTVVTAGWDHLVADINGEWIFRFPRSEEMRSLLEREHWLLNCLKSRISIPVPNYQYEGAEIVFVGYRKILGEPLSRYAYLKLSSEKRQATAHSLALFLTQLHKAVTVEEALHWGYEEYSLPLGWIEEDLPHHPEVKRIILEALVYAKEYPGARTNRVLLHNDIHAENVVFDATTGQITGVFDFSDAVVGDYACDFSKLFTIHEDLVKDTAELYADLNHVANPLIPAAVDYILRRAYYIKFAQENGNKAREATLLAMLKHFVPIWDAL